MENPKTEVQAAPEPWAKRPWMENTYRMIAEAEERIAQGIVDPLFDPSKVADLVASDPVEFYKWPKFTPKLKGQQLLAMLLLAGTLDNDLGIVTRPVETLTLHMRVSQEEAETIVVRLLRDDYLLVAQEGEDGPIFHDRFFLVHYCYRNGLPLTLEPQTRQRPARRAA